MAVNRYDNPAQAKFMNTYVPIPFEQLYTLGKQAKADVDKAMTDLSSTLDKWSDFRSPSAIDTQNWYNETLGKAKPIVDKLASNLDLLKSPEGKAQIYSLINNVDRAKLSTLMQSREGLLTRQKVNQQLMLNGKYNPLWHDVDFSNYNTLDSGIYNDIAPLAYSSIKDITDQYVNNLKDSFISRSGGWIHTGVTGDQIKNILDSNRSGILSTPQAQKHMEVYMKQNPGATQDEAAEWLMQKAYTDNQEYIRDNVSVDPYAMEALKQQNANLRAGLKNKGKGEAEAAPSTYDMLFSDAARNEQEIINSPGIFDRTKKLNSLGATLEKRKQEALQELDVYKDALANGQITQEQYNNAEKKYAEDFALAGESYVKSLETAYRDDLREIFTKQTAVLPTIGNQTGEPIAYYESANRTLDVVMKPAAGVDLDTYNENKYGASALVNQADLSTKVYQAKTTSGLVVSNYAVNKLMGVNNAPSYIKDNRGKSRDFPKDLQNGVIKNVLLSPSNTVTVMRDSDGGNKMVQRFSVMIPKSSLLSAGYDVDNIDDYFKDNFGIEPVSNIKVNGLLNNTAENQYGEQTTSKRSWYNPITWHTDTYNRIPVAGSGDYFILDVVDEIRPDDINRMNLDIRTDKSIGGTSYAKENVNLRASDTYDTGDLDF